MTKERKLDDSELAKISGAGEPIIAGGATQQNREQSKDPAKKIVLEVESGNIGG